MELVHTTPGRVRMDAGALRDLDLFRLAGLFLPERDERGTEAWFGEYLTDDAEELARRSALLDALGRVPDGDARLEALNRRRDRLHRLVTRLCAPKERLLYCVFTMRALREYVEAAHETDALLAALDGTEPAALAAESAATLAEAGFREQEALLASLEARFSPPKSAVIGVNVEAGMSASSFALVEALGDDPAVRGAFDAASDASPAESLLGYTPFRGGASSATFERFLITQIEKQWRGRVAEVWRDVRRVDFGAIAAWLDMTASIDFLLAGRRWAQLLERRGYVPRSARCRPGKFEGRGVRYPHMCAVGKTVVASDTSFADGAPVFITGGNHSGKSSYLKTVAQSMALAQLGFPLPSDEFAFSPRTAFLTLFAKGEDDAMRTSRFGAELERFRTLAPLADAGALVLLNEPFSGAEPEEAAETCARVVEEIAARGATTLVVTHLYEAYFRLKRGGTRAPVSVVTGSRVVDGRLVYPYTLAMREPDCQSYAERIAADMGVSYELLLDGAHREAVGRYLREARR